ncbi:hypothetical protein P7266_1709 [Lactococcus cremoris]|nr:hypothetical protein P7266_1709 [Lactococcus cremoris]
MLLSLVFANFYIPSYLYKKQLAPSQPSLCVFDGEEGI